MSDLYETMLARLEVGLQDELRRARSAVAENMQAARLDPAAGWTVGFRPIIAEKIEDRLKPGGERYYFVPVRIENGVSVEQRPDLSMSVVVC